MFTRKLTTYRSTSRKPTVADVFSDDVDLTSSNEDINQSGEASPSLQTIIEEVASSEPTQKRQAVKKGIGKIVRARDIKKRFREIRSSADSVPKDTEISETTVDQDFTKPYSSDQLNSYPQDISYLYAGLEPEFQPRHQAWPQQKRLINLDKEPSERITKELCTRASVLFVDDIGFDNIWDASSSSKSEIIERLQHPTEFYLISTKKEKKVLLQLDRFCSEVTMRFPNDSTKKRHYPLLNVSEVRIGPKTKIFEINQTRSSSFHAAFSVHFVCGREINLIPHNTEIGPCWIKEFVKLVGDAKDEQTDLAYIQRIWKSYEKQVLSLKEITSIFTALGVEVPESHILSINPVVAKTGLTFEQFIEILRIIRTRKEIDNLFNEYSIDGEHIFDKQFVRFLYEQQGQTDYSMDNISSLLEPFRDSSDRHSHRRINRRAFEEFLTSPFNEPSSNCTTTIYQNMDHPITDYYIFSSHNTYLEGNQLSGKSSCEMYMRVLKAGCRCVELDCWNGDNGEPIIFHGYTLTSKILFHDVIKTIRDYAFITTDYPVILSLENHCNVEQQTKMARIMKKYFGDNLAMPLNSDYNKKHLPSPSQLKRKIVIKGKVTADSSFTPAPELVEITYLVSVSINNFSTFNSEKHKPWEMCSLVEKKLATLNLPNQDFVEYNKTNFSRIYPKGTRFESSNYEADPWWVGGSQMVALNLQTQGTISWTNEGKFKDNGACGYVLKPDFMLHNSPKPFNPNSFVSAYPIRLSISIFSARQLPPSPRKATENVNPYVQVWIRGCKKDTMKRATSSVKNNRFNPSWNTTLEFNITMPELAIMLIVVKHSGNRFKTPICYYALPVGCLRTGYRVVRLYQNGVKCLMADLFCKFTITPRNASKVVGVLTSNAQS